MAPAAKASSQGISGWMPPAASTTAMPNTGSTAPDRLPYTKLRVRESPSCRSGSEMAAPSGKFWMPMPAASASAVASAAGSPVWAARAKLRPTAIPSGMLCRVTALTSRVVRRQPQDGPSHWAAPGCRCGIR